VTLNFDPVTLKFIGFICYPGWRCGPSLRKVGQGALGVIGGKQKGCKPTCAKQYALSFLKWGITMGRS